MILVLVLAVGCAARAVTALYSVEAVWQYGNVIYAVKIRDGSRVCYVPAGGSGIACYDE